MKVILTIDFQDEKKLETVLKKDGATLTEFKSMMKEQLSEGWDDAKEIGAIVTLSFAE